MYPTAAQRPLQRAGLPRLGDILATPAVQRVISSLANCSLEEL